MKLIHYIAGISFLSTFAVASCSHEELMETGEGSVRLSVLASDRINVLSRALSDEVQATLEKDCRVRIFSGETLVQKYLGTAEIPAEIPLASGSYKATVYAGDSLPASFTTSYYYGEEPFEVKKGMQVPVEVECSIGNTVVTVSLSEEMKAALKDYSVTVSSSVAEGSLKFTPQNEGAKGFFTVPLSQPILKYKLSGTAKDGHQVSSEGTIGSIQRSTLYKLNFKLAEGGTEGGNTGGGKRPALSVSTYSLKPVNHEVVLPQRVTVACVDKTGSKIDLSAVAYWNVNATNAYTFHVASFQELTTFQLTLPQEAVSDWGFASAEVDLMKASEEELQKLRALGVDFVKPVQHDADVVYRGSMTLNETLIAKMTGIESGQTKSYRMAMKAVDTDQRFREVVWNVVVSADRVTTSPSVDYEVWTRKATLRGKLVAADASSVQPKFRYRLKDTQEWTEVDATLDGMSFSAEVTGLTPGSTYEYQAMEGTQASAVVESFTTESLFQPSNAGFESIQDGSPLLIHGAGEPMWWDSGNHGSATMKKNVTTVDTSVKHGGNQSLCMSSQFVGFMGIGKFAAGNVFAGQYLQTDGMDGVLGWGRPCSSRPTAMKLWVRYEPGMVDYADGLPAGAEIQKGGKDQAIVYVSVGDWTGMDYNGTPWSFVVKTKGAASLFSTSPDTYSGKGIVAYGEKIFSEAIGGESMVEVTIPLDYEHYGKDTRKPTSIILVASASRYGDYFCGSTGSKLWIDDVELVYE